MKISEIIISWYKKNKRDLPWRKTKDPYCIWLSEIILQQTKVSQGLEYYTNFLESYPDVKSLALASEQEVLKLWQGLGYYTRARNLHGAAKQVIHEFNGQFPSDFVSLRKLKGVGPYTASAIASIAFKIPVAVVDGNVERVISRLFAVSDPVNSTSGGKIIQKLASELLDTDNPADHNQAMMEFGALQCVPLNPQCHTCVLNDKCLAFLERRVSAFPVKIKKIKTRTRFFTYFIITQDKDTFIHQRNDRDIWQKMYEFPMLESEAGIEIEDLELAFEEFSGLSTKDYRIRAVSEAIKHQLSHQKLYARFIHVDIAPGIRIQGRDWQKISWSEINDYPIPRLLDKYLESNI